MKLRFSRNPHVRSRTVDVSQLNPLYFLIREPPDFGFLDDPLACRRIVDTYELVITRNPRTGRTYRRYRWVKEKRT